jgi:hypothetical protein
MKRIDSTGATVDGRFKITPAPATRVSYDWLNMVQDELCTVITDADGGNAALDPASTTQLLAAIQRIVTTATGGLGVRKRGVVTGILNPGTYQHVFDEAFPTICNCPIANVINTTGSGARDVWVQIQSWNKNGFYYVIQTSATGGDNSCDGITWMADGA